MLERNGRSSYAEPGDGSWEGERKLIARLLQEGRSHLCRLIVWRWERWETFKFSFSCALCSEGWRKWSPGDYNSLLSFGWLREVSSCAQRRKHCGKLLVLEAGSWQRGNEERLEKKKIASATSQGRRQTLYGREWMTKASGDWAQVAACDVLCGSRYASSSQQRRMHSPFTPV